MLLNWPFIYETFLLCSQKSISKVHVASSITSASSARQYFCTLVSSDMWELQSLKENNDHNKFCLLYPLTLKDDYHTDLKIWKFKNHGLTYVCFILFSRMALWNTSVFSFLTTESTTFATTDMAYCSVLVEEKSDLLMKKTWYDMAWPSSF